MLFVGYFEGIDSQRGIAWRIADRLSLRAFLGIAWNEFSYVCETRTSPMVEVVQGVEEASTSALIDFCNTSSVRKRISPPIGFIFKIYSHTAFDICYQNRYHAAVPFETVTGLH
jgi:hypothetical protein